MNDVEAIWNMIEKFKNDKQTELNKKDLTASDSQSNGTPKESEDSTENKNESKKRKQIEDQNETNHQSEENKKTKKKKQMENEITENQNGLTEKLEQTGDKKKTKKKKQIENGISEENGTKVAENATAEKLQQIENKKKTKTTKQVENGTGEKLQQTENKKTKKRKHEDSSETTENSTNGKPEETALEKCDNGKKIKAIEEEKINDISIENTKFNFKNKILEILQSAGSPISLEKLHKKVKKSYRKETGQEFTDKIQKKYLKKLEKLQNVVCTEHSVHICETIQ